MTTATRLYAQRSLRSMSSPLEFWDIIRRECDRADRYGIRLSMVVYTTGFRHAQSKKVRTQSRKLFERVRRMDFIGMLGTGQLGVLMPHTPKSSATLLAQDIYKLLRPLTSPLPFTVYTYPSTLWPTKKSIPLRLLKIIKNIRAMVFRTGITESGELQLQLDMEMDRANRYGYTFALLIFHSQVIITSGIPLHNLAQVLNTRLRETDIFGWYGPNDIAVILPYSDHTTATKIGKEICEIVGVQATGSFTAYAYPNLWLTPDTEPCVRETPYSQQQPFSLRNEVESKAFPNKNVTQTISHGHEVSLHIVNTKDLNTKSGSIPVLIRNINNRFNKFNNLGLFEKENIGTLLPYFTHEAATQLGHYICETNQLAVQEVISVNSYQNNRFQTPIFFASTPQGAENRSPDDICRQDLAPMYTTQEMYDLLAQPLPTWKRALDIFGALCGVILLSPLFFLAIAGIRFSSPGPIIFWQTRIGYKKKPFKMLKFRSMHANVGIEKHRNFMKEIISTNKGCPNTKIKNDERVFPFGAFLRKTSIDELPQLFNVLKGEMSLVGPRPCLDYEADEYMQWHTRRFCIMPGITGLWQVSGKNRLSFEQMIRLDILYVKKVSMWMDLKIIFKTLPAVISIYFEKDI